ncbi:uncharacterized protein LOC131207931 [Anopheles bellator]|uniref:uncharacterized protein LOC131207931 n=1 Tax=Anopheles bellator TaxID=139047 RepID=UPI0026498EB3|nr:uncharacterized protein LOC131207931 [Anopheles bellator]
MHHRRLQRWMRQRTLQLFMVTALCIMGLEGTVLDASPQTKDNASPAQRPDPEPVAREGPNGTASTAVPGADRQRRLIPYMQYYVTSTAAPAGPDNGDYQQPPQSPYSQLYNYRPITVPSSRDTGDGRPNGYSPKHSSKQQQQQRQPIYRPVEEAVPYDGPYQSPRPSPHRKPYYGAKLVPAVAPGGLKALPVSVNPFTYEYNHRHQSPAKVVGSPHGPTSYALVGSAPQSPSTEHGGHGPQTALDHVVEVYERPKYAVIPRERDPYESPRFAVLPPATGKLYGVEVHPKSQPHGGGAENVEIDPLAGAKYFLPTVAPESRKPSLYQAVPVYKKSRINPFLPSNTIPGPFTPMISGAPGATHVDPTGNQEPRVKEHAVQVTFVKSVSKETVPPAVEYQPYVTASPVQSNRVHGEVSQSPYLLVKTVPKFYYEKPRSAAPVSSTAAPYPVYYKEKPSDGRKQHYNHTGYTRTRIPVAVIRVPVESHPANEGFAEPPSNAGYYSVGSYYKYPEQAAAPPRQHLTETVLAPHPQKHVVHPDPPVSKAPPATPPGQYFLGANYKIIKVPVKQQPYPVDQPYPVSYAPQRLIPSTTPVPIVYSTTPSTTPAPVHETPDYQPAVYHGHGQRPVQYQIPARSNRTEYANRQRFYPQSMRHPSQHKPRPIPLVPPTDDQELGLPAGSASGSLSDLLKSLQDSNLLPKTLTPDNIDNSIRTLVKILNNLKANGRPTAERVAPGPAYGRRQNHTVPEPEDGYVDADQYQGGSPPMLINKIVTPGPNTGKPGIDYPALAEIPETSFSCKEQRYKGFFGDPETNCQVWHYCDLNGGKASFLCPNGTIFSQVALTCDWWFNVKCSTTAQLYVLNERLYKYILPFTPKFPEDYSGPLVDKYLALKFQEMEEKMKQQRAKGAKQTEEPLPNTEPDNDEVNGNRLEDNDDRYNQNQPYPVKYVTTEAIAERAPVVPVLASKPVPRPVSPSGAITLEDIDAELQPGGAGAANDRAGTSTTAGSPMTSEEADDPGAVTPVPNYRTSSPATTTLIINTEEPSGPDPYQEEMMMMMLVEPEDRVEHEYANVVSTEQSPPTAAPLLSKVRRIEVKNDGTSGHLIRTPSYDRRRKK